ncbi:MAG: family transporter protein [Marmoricola sp.]|nr:family transporter protein [Marmoricola sp.]
MIHLVRTELARYRSRRVITLLLLLAALLAAVVAFQSAWETRPPSKAEIATAQAQAEVDAGRSDIQTDIDRCLADPGSYLGTGATAQECRNALSAAPTSYLTRSPLDLRGTLKGNGIGLALLIIVLLIIAASTFAGADWGSGSIRNQTLFEPRRSRLWAAKAIAVTLASGVAALVTLGGFWLTLYLVAASRGVDHSSAVVADVSWHLLRAVILAMAAGLGAFSLTMMFRRSVATLALLFVYSIGGEILISVLPFNDTGRWSLGNNVLGWLQTRLEYFDPHSPCSRLGTCAGPDHLGHGVTGLYLLVLVVLAGVSSWASFRRRDL